MNEWSHQVRCSTHTQPRPGLPTRVRLRLRRPPLPLLLGQDGAYTPFLKLARACEDASADALSELTHALGLSADAVNRAQLSALKFADTLEF